MCFVLNADQTDNVRQVASSIVGQLKVNKMGNELFCQLTTVKTICSQN